MAKNTQSLTVPQLLETLSHPLLPLIHALREVILDAHPQVGEEVKWNSPSFYFTGEMAPFDPKTYARDIVVLHLRKPGQVLMVFPTGARIADASGVLEGSYVDGRRMITLTSMEDLAVKKDGIRQVIVTWIKGVK